MFDSLLALRWWFNSPRLLCDAWLLHATRLFCRSWLFHSAWLFYPLLCCLRWRCSAFLTLAFISHLELLSLRPIRHRIHTHRLREVRPERRRRRRVAGYYSRIAQLARDSRWDVDLAATPC